MRIVDIRSDTVTKPSHEMRKAMFEAEVGDDVYGEDPTVNRLQKTAAEMLGTEAAIFTTSGTQSNLMALLSHCERGDEYIVGQRAHTYCNEGGGGAVFGAIQPQPLDMKADGTLDLDEVKLSIKPHDIHYPRTKLICLENTTGGRVLPLDYLAKARSLADDHGLGMHLDGARLFNAVIKLDTSVQEIARHFDTISFCLSKGLGAPIGSILCGTSSIIEKARRWRKVLGGGMRQAGIIAAAGIYALENNIKRLAEDHAKALTLARGLAEIDELDIDMKRVQTNMVIFIPGSKIALGMHEFLGQHGFRIGKGPLLRFVMHLDVTDEDVDRLVGLIKEFFSKKG